MAEIQYILMALGSQQTMGRVESSPSVFKLIAAVGRVLNTLAFKLVVEEIQDDDNNFVFVSDTRDFLNSSYKFIHPGPTCLDWFCGCCVLSSSLERKTLPSLHQKQSPSINFNRQEKKNWVLDLTYNNSNLDPGLRQYTHGRRNKSCCVNF